MPPTPRNHKNTMSELILSSHFGRLCACAKMLFTLKFYLKLLFRVALRANYYVTEDKVPLFYCHFLLPLNN